MIRSELRPHRPVDLSGSFRFTDAVCPKPGMPFDARTGYRLESYSRHESGPRIPVLAAAVTRERLFDAFLRLLEPLGDEVDVVLETSHGSDRHRDLRRRHIDRPVLESHFCDFEDLLLNDGCTGVAVIATRKPMEVQFDEHKTLVCYARDLGPFQSILESAAVPLCPELPLVFDTTHLHFSKPDFATRFGDMAWRIGVGAEADMVAG